MYDDARPTCTTVFVIHIIPNLAFQPPKTDQRNWILKLEEKFLGWNPAVGRYFDQPLVFTLAYFRRDLYANKT